MEDSVIAQGAGMEPAPAAPASPVSGTDGAGVKQSGGEAVPESRNSAGDGVPSQGEEALNQEIRQLWAAHHEALAEAKRRKEEALGILLELGRLLSGAKESLARPGRNGGWSSFVRSLGFSRAEADGLVRRYRGALEPQAACSTGREATTATLATEPAAAVAEARPEAREEVVVPAPATGPVQQPSGETPAAIEEPTSETAATPTEAVQPAEAAPEVSGGDAASAPGGLGAAVAAIEAASGKPDTVLAGEAAPACEGVILAALDAAPAEETLPATPDTPSAEVAVV